MLGGYRGSGDLEPALTALFNNPYGVWGLSSGRLLVSDSGNQVVRALSGPPAPSADPTATPSTVPTPSPSIRTTLGLFNISTAAGTPHVSAEGGVGGMATSASFGHPFGVWAATDRSLYFSDHLHSRLLRVGPQGILSVFAGNGTNSAVGDGGAASSASLAGVWALWGDSAGNVFLTQASFTVRRVDAVSNRISTIAGNFI